MCNPRSADASSVYHNGSPDTKTIPVWLIIIIIIIINTIIIKRHSRLSGHLITKPDFGVMTKKRANNKRNNSNFVQIVSSAQVKGLLSALRSRSQTIACNFVIYHPLRFFDSPLHISVIN